MGLTFGLCGAVIAWHRPGNPIGWLFIADGIGHATTAVTTPIGQLLADTDAPMRRPAPGRHPLDVVPGRGRSGCSSRSLLLLFPTGRLLSPRWRWVAIGIVAHPPAVRPGDGRRRQRSRSSTASRLATCGSRGTTLSQPLWTVAELRNLVALLLAVACLVIRYRRADEMGRRQLLWLLLASVVAIAVRDAVVLRRRYADPGAARDSADPGGRRGRDRALPAARHPAGRLPRARPGRCCRWLPSAPTWRWSRCWIR